MKAIITLVFFFCIANNTTLLYAEDPITYVEYDSVIYIDTWNVYTVNFFNPSPEYGGDGNFDIWKHPDEIVINSWQNAEILVDGSNMPLALDLDFDLDENSGSWIKASYHFLYKPSIQTGNWNDDTVHYLGMRTNKEGKWYYGWLRMEVDNEAAYFKLYDYAFNNTGGPIKTGQTSATPVEKQENQNPPFQFGNNKVIINPEGIKNGIVYIYNYTGALLFNQTLNNETKEISLDRFVPGLYFIIVDLNGHLYSGSFVR